MPCEGGLLIYDQIFVDPKIRKPKCGKHYKGKRPKNHRNKKKR